MPGAVGGDIIKAFYVCRENSQRKTPVLLSILLDRIIGLLGLFVAASLYLIFAGRALIITNFNFCH